MTPNAFEKIIDRKLPPEYTEFLELFKEFLVTKEKGTKKVFYFDSIKALSARENIGNHKNVYFFEKLKYLLKENSLASGNVFCHSSNSFIDIERINSSIIIANYDGTYLYFDTLDNFSVWEFWLDDGSVGKIADNFKNFLNQYNIEHAE